MDTIFSAKRKTRYTHFKMGKPGIATGLNSWYEPRGTSLNCKSTILFLNSNN
jgi:hypothetical protein